MAWSSFKTSEIDADSPLTVVFAVGQTGTYTGRWSETMDIPLAPEPRKVIPLPGLGDDEVGPVPCPFELET